MAKRRGLIALAAAAVVASGCGGDGAGDANPTPDPRDDAALLRVTADGLCRTLDLVETGNLEGAREVFFNQSHDFLHQIAAKGRDAVPRETALLLEAKGKIEQGLADPGQASAELPQAVFDAHAALTDLGSQLGLPAPEPCREAAS